MNDVESLKLYEVGYLISPLVQEAEVGEAVERIIRTPIGARSGQVTGDLPPVLRRLAYRVATRLAAKKSYFQDAYFGAIRFEATPEALKEIKEAWEKQDELLRYILVALPKGSDKVIHLRRYSPRPAVASRPTRGEAPVDAPVNVPGAPMTTEEIDKEIEGLLEDNPTPASTEVVETKEEKD